MKLNDVIELHVKEAYRLEILRTKKYRRYDELTLVLEARKYLQDRLPVNDRITATAILLHRDAVHAAKEAREAYWRENNNPSALVDPWSL